MIRSRGPYVLIVEDHPLVADSLAACIRACDPGLHVQTAESLHRALATLAILPDPVLILTDLTLTDANGMEAVRRLRRAAAQSKLLVCTALDETKLRDEAAALGVSGYLIKNAAIQTLREEICRAVGSPNSSGSQRSASPTQSKPTLTTRQVAILEELSSGRSNKEIALRMNITPDTVGSHMKEILTRLSARNRTEAVAYYLQLKSQRRE
jgi:DNA-binding NarL/FixJ family response regulator